MTDNVGFCRMTLGGFSEKIIGFEFFSLETWVEEIASPSRKPALINRDRGKSKELLTITLVVIESGDRGSTDLNI